MKLLNAYLFIFFETNPGPDFQWKKRTKQETKSQSPAMVVQELEEKT